MTSVFAVTDWQFWAQAIKFLVGVWFVWYLPGRFLLRFIPELPKTAPKVALCWTLGLVLWTLLAFLLGWLNLRFLLPFMTLGLASYELIKFKLNVGHSKIISWSVWFGLVVGLIIQMPAVMTSGWLTERGFELFFTNAEDGMMHVSFIQNLVTHFPPQRPEVAGVMLTNYHFFSDLATAELVRVFKLPILATFYQFLPPLISVLSGYLIYSLVLAWSNKPRAGWLSLFFWYLGGDLGYLISLVLHGEWRWFAAAIDNGADQFLNPPQTFAKLVFLAGLWLLNLYWQKPSQSAWWLTIILFSSLVGFKVYFGLFVILALGLATLFRMVTRQAKNYEWLGVAVIGIVAVGIIFPTSQSAGGLKYLPLVWPKLLFKVEHLDWEWWRLQSQSIWVVKDWWKVALLNMSAILVSLVAIFGTRAIAWMGVHQVDLPNQSSWRWFWIPTMLLFVFIGLNFVQDPGGLNTFNFLIVATIPLACFSAMLVDKWLGQKNSWLKLLVIIFLVLTPARSLRNSWHFIDAMFRHDSAGRMTRAELELTGWLRQNTHPNDIIQSHFNSGKTSQGTYLSFFSQRQTFLTGRNILGTHGLTFPDKVAVLTQAAEAPNYTSLQTALKATPIKYYYVENMPGQKEFMDKTDVADHTIFSNSAGWIIKL